jgi:hypothetical protein
MKRNPDEFYSHGGSLYGPMDKGVSVRGSTEELDDLAPIKTKTKGKGPEQIMGASREPQTGTVSSTGSANNAETGGEVGLKPEQYGDSSGPELLAEVRRRGLEAPANPKVAQLRKILEQHDEELVNKTST